jgi:hypothetical protein
MIDSTALKELLRERVEELSPYLFPNGRREGAQWCVGDVTGAPGKSFKICLAGDKKGLWGDFADTEKHSRSLLDLWMQARNVDFKTAVREAAEWTGQSYNGSRRATPLPRREEARKSFDWQACVDAFTDEHLERFGEWRGYSVEFCSWLKENKLVGLYDGCIAFPVHASSGAVVGCHCRVKQTGRWKYEPEGNKVVPLIIGLVNGEVHIFESQWDALAVRSMFDKDAAPSVIATRGAGNSVPASTIPSDVAVFAWKQNDEPGAKWLTRILEAFPRARTPIIPAPHKDFNDWCKAGLQGIDLMIAIKESETVREAGAPELSQLLEETIAALQENITFVSEHQTVVIALWVAHTHCIQHFYCTGFLNISSPVKRCGKSNLLTCLEFLTARAWKSVTPSVAVLYRRIARECPTLLLDEVDRSFADGESGKQELLAILNVGYKRGATVDRCGGANRDQLESFPVFCPKAFAGIGRLPDTTQDRCFPIRLERQKRRARRRFNEELVESQLRPIGERFVAWAQCEHLIKSKLAVSILDSAFPESISDRAVEICEPLYKLAIMAGGDWFERIRTATAAIFGAEEDENKATLQLTAICEAFGKDESLSTSDLIDRLLTQDDSPFPDWWFKSSTEKPSIGRSLARILKPFGIKAKRIWIGDDRIRGYERTNLAPIWERYCPPRNSTSVFSDALSVPAAQSYVND